MGQGVKVLAMWAVIIVMVYGIVATGSRPASAQECPSKIQGNESAELKVQYFGQKFCPYCMMQEPVFKKLTKEHGDKIAVEYYDVKSCVEGVRKYAVTGTPTLVFEHAGVKQIVRGYLDELAIKQIMCEKIGMCK